MPRKKNKRKQKQAERRAADTVEKKKSPRRVAMIAHQAHGAGAAMAIAAMVGGLNRISR